MYVVLNQGRISKPYKNLRLARSKMDRTGGVIAYVPPGTPWVEKKPVYMTYVRGC